MPRTRLALLRSLHLVRALLGAAALLAICAGSPAKTRAQTAGPGPESAATESVAPESAPAKHAAPERAEATTVRAPEATPEAITDTERAPNFVSPVEVTRWYGWQTLLADVASVGLVATGIAVTSIGAGNDAGVPLVFVGLAGYVAGTPLIHLVHDNRWALGSVLARSVAVGLTVGGTIDTAHCIGGGSCWGGGPALMVTGLALALIITVADASLARERYEQPRVTFAPWANPQARSGGLSLAARW